MILPSPLKKIVLGKKRSSAKVNSHLPNIVVIEGIYNN